MLSRSRWLILTLWLVSLIACGTPAATPTSVTDATSAPAPTSAPVAATPEPTRNLTSSPLSAAATATPSTVSTTAPGSNAAAAQVPSSCSAIVTLVGAYMGGVASTKSLGSPQHLSCEFANANASTIVIVNIGVGGTVAAFDALRASSAQGGRTVASIAGLGSSAFSVSKNNVPAGVSVLTAQGLIYAVISNLPIAQDEALIEQLMKLP